MSFISHENKKSNCQNKKLLNLFKDSFYLIAKMRSISHSQTFLQYKIKDFCIVYELAHTYIFALIGLSIDI